MEGSSSVVEELRVRLQRLERRHEALGGAATPAFLESLGRTGSGAPGLGESAGPTETTGPSGGSPAGRGGAGGAGRRPAGTAGPAGPAGTAGPAGPGGPADEGARGAGGGGRRTKDARLASGPARRGPWAGVPAPCDLDPDPVAGLSDTGSVWGQHGAMGDWFDREVAAGRGPVAADPGWVDRVDPTLVTVDAVLGASLARHDGSHLTSAAEHVAALRGSHDVMLVQILAEVLTREAELGQGLPRGLRPVDWLRALDPTLTAAAAKAFVTVASAIGLPRWARLRAEVVMQLVTVAKAAQVIDFHERVAPVADPDQLAPVLEELIGQAQTARPEELARMIREETEQLTPPQDAEDLERGQRAARGLWFGPPNPAGMVGMRGTLDPEAAAVIRSAVDALAAPAPEQDGCGHTVAPDPRTPAKRRADALVDLVGRAVAAADGVPVTDKAKVVVTIGLEALVGRVRGSGMTLAGAALTASIVRRLACNAAVIPMVLGSRSEPLDVGRTRRFVTAAMRIALHHRDRGCSWRGCSVPASWCDAHHVLPWYRGGSTKLGNFALLCSRHHHHVHSHELTATVTATGVTWHE